MFFLYFNEAVNPKNSINSKIKIEYVKKLTIQLFDNVKLIKGRIVLLVPKKL